MKLVQAKRAAEITGLTRQTIQNWMRKGIIKTHKVGHALFVDADTLEKLADTIDDVKNSYDGMLSEKEAFEEYADDYRKMRNGVMNRVWRTRYLYLVMNSAIKTDFYKSVINIMCTCGIINQREGKILSLLLENWSFNEVAGELDITPGRVKQIAKGALHKSKSLSGIINKITEVEIKDAYIDDLKTRIEDLKGQLSEIENTKLMREKMAAEEYVSERMSCDPVLKIIKKPVNETALSIRALNALRYLGIESVGEIASRRKSEFLRARNCGKKTISELNAFLLSNNLEFGMDTDQYREQKKQEFFDEWKKINNK